MSKTKGIFEILQIIPGTGWKAVYKKQNGHSKEIPLACFALVREDKLNYVLGMTLLSDDRRVISPSLCKDFLGYVGPGETLDQFNEGKE